MSLWFPHRRFTGVSRVHVDHGCRPVVREGGIGGGVSRNGLRPKPIRPRSHLHRRTSCVQASQVSPAGGNVVLEKSFALKTNLETVLVLTAFLLVLVLALAALDSLKPEIGEIPKLK